MFAIRELLEQKCKDNWGLHPSTLDGGIGKYIKLYNVNMFGLPLFDLYGHSNVREQIISKVLIFIYIYIYIHIYIYTYI